MNVKHNLCTIRIPLLIHYTNTFPCSSDCSHHVFLFDQEGVMEMGLDIDFIERRNVICQHCGEIVKTEDVSSECSGGKSWYPILEHLGYYVSYDERTEENDWYGKDMVLTAEQAKEVYRQIKMNIFEFYRAEQIMSLIAQAMMNESQVVINADW